MVDMSGNIGLVLYGVLPIKKDKPEQLTWSVITMSLLVPTTLSKMLIFFISYNSFNLKKNPGLILFSEKTFGQNKTEFFF